MQGAPADEDVLGERVNRRKSVQVLIIDDDPVFRMFTTAAMEAENIAFECAENATRGLELLEERPRGTFDLILLDVEMPGPSGWDLLQEIRERGDEIPVIFVTGVERVDSRVKGLKMGADDYLVKPVEYEELIARMEAVLRRRHALEPILYGDLTLDLVHRRAIRSGKQTNLSPKEFDVVVVLAQANGEVVSRAKLLEEVWDMRNDPGTNVLDVHIGRIRRKFQRHGRPLIQTVRGEGYKLLRRDAD